jgi:hypothetical protein
MDGMNPAVKPGFWLAIGIGGLVVAIFSFAQQYSSKLPEEPFRMRSVVRDFFLGAFLSATIYMFLPESIDSWTSGLLTNAPSGGSFMTGGSSNAAAAAGAGLSSDLELQTGPARF